MNIGTSYVKNLQSQTKILLNKLSIKDLSKSPKKHKSAETIFNTSKKKENL